MRLLVATTAGAGHFGPIVPFAAACARAGHEVRVAAPASFESAVVGAGFDHVAVADPDPEELGAVFARLPTMSVEESNEVVLREVFAGIDARAAGPAMDEVVHGWQPDLVLRDAMEFSSYVAAERFGVPHVEVAPGLASIGELAVSMLGDALDPLGAPRGVTGLREAPRLLSTPASLDGLAERTADRRFRYTAKPGPGGLPMTRDHEMPLVYASFGTVAPDLGFYPDLYRAVVDATTQKAQLLVTTGETADTGLLEPLPDGVHVEAFWAQADVMPYAAAVIGHGGFGTTMTALAAGVPVISVPLFASDQFLMADAVAVAGAGLPLAGGPNAASDLAGMLERILDDSFSAAARRIAAEIDALPDPAVAVALLEQIAAEG